MQTIIHYSSGKRAWYLELTINGVRIYDSAYCESIDVMRARAIRVSNNNYTIHPIDAPRWAEGD